MDNPGPFTLGDFQIGAAGQYGGQNPAQGQPGASPIVCDLEGMHSCSIQLRFSGGAGGGGVMVYIQTSLDQGQTWFDVAAVAFTTVASVVWLNLAAASAAGPAVAQSLSMPAGAVGNVAIGDRLQMVAVSAGTYPASTLLSGRGIAR